MTSARLAVAIAGAAVALASCSGASGDTASDTPATTASEGPGPFFGVCGGLTDDEVLAAFAVPAFAVVTRNSVGCEWETSGPTGPSVSFSWYRGSPIGRERMGSELIGRPAEDIEIDGQPGFEARSENATGQTYLCENGLQYGDDFVHFSVMYADSVPTADPCAVARGLLETVAERAQ
ncbi:DUF3558 domain-containing protein [Rhodococcus sp. MEB064]|uniref:DUF3558 domain-containing protein n=1 Tax=Rhodococcus sp. MEB064 TaxID=1587522 RepID=UPI0005ACC8CB|nr:DUF3558 domain-containing protein [Rhodococcus sp. MEB064]KIQ18298.1 lipoprotein LprB [Rhodococcus sp. MEB064]